MGHSPPRRQAMVSRALEEYQMDVPRNTWNKVTISTGKRQSEK
jgi:hypothetical protein